ncbi:MAG: hypothetical protein BWX64_00290 [Acidobacteria bacterium ADurb.Bin051]|jgi:hypothetical protein|nr:MAG: hypothetical protein BWX64_00290 [Acidobacteria bacterium ADurb.Bin051]
MGAPRARVTERTARDTAWREGPPKWTFSAYGIALATVHLVLAGFGVGSWLTLWDGAWPFYASLLAITSGSAVALHLGRQRRRPVVPDWGADPYGLGGGDDGREHEELEVGLPTPPRVGDR